jgi:hypothetical protein
MPAKKFFKNLFEKTRKKPKPPHTPQKPQPTYGLEQRGIAQRDPKTGKLRSRNPELTKIIIQAKKKT